MRASNSAVGGSPRCSQMTRTTGSVWLTRTWNQRSGQSTRRPSDTIDAAVAVVALELREQRRDALRDQRHLALQDAVVAGRRPGFRRAFALRSSIIDEDAEHGRDAVVDETESRHHHCACAFAGDGDLLRAVRGEGVHRGLTSDGNADDACRRACARSLRSGRWWRGW